jgi:MFS family permease
MAVGTAVGAVPAFLPPPTGLILAWVCYGAFGGAAVPAVMLSSLPEKGHTRLWWYAIWIGCGLGSVIGFVVGLQRDELPDWAIVATCSCGFFAGYAVAEFLIRRRDRRLRVNDEEDD